MDLKKENMGPNDEEEEEEEQTDSEDDASDDEVSLPSLSFGVAQRRAILRYLLYHLCL